jgi:NAD(P)-dependent dehydrogenase (short-subunit alcohol dehydrogenase family)
MKTAFVTGASSGIGAAMVHELLDAGYIVYAGARRTDRLADVVKDGAVPLMLDVTDEGSMVDAISTILSTSGHIDVLVNNAGYGSFGALEDVPLSEGRRQFDVNVFGLARLTQLVLPSMRVRRSGTIVNVSSIGGKIHEPFGSWYHATKFAVEGMSDCLRSEAAPFGIKVIVIQPGAIKTEWNRIARTNLLKFSGENAYGPQAKAYANFLERADTSSSASEPSVVAKTLMRALASKNPKTRYATGGGARTILNLRWLLSDKMFDWVMRKVSGMNKTVNQVG